VLAEAPVASLAAMLFALLRSFDEASSHKEFNSRARGKNTKPRPRSNRQTREKQNTEKTREGEDDKSRSGNALREDDDETLRANPQSHGSDLFSVKGPQMLGDKTTMKP
jgi:hypothetical protein